jgi:hypothetical protein
MTEQEWVGCADPKPMLEFLRGKVSERKLRLFAAACCRRIWSLPPDERSHLAVEMTERYVDGQATQAEWECVADLYPRQTGGCMSPPADPARSALVVHVMFVPDVIQETDRIIGYATRELAAGDAALAYHAALQCESDLVRGIFNPFRPVALAPSWRTPSPPWPTPPTRSVSSRPASLTPPDCASSPTPSKRRDAPRPPSSIT